MTFALSGRYPTVKSRNTAMAALAWTLTGGAGLLLMVWMLYADLGSFVGPPLLLRLFLLLLIGLPIVTVCMTMGVVRAHQADRLIARHRQFKDYRRPLTVSGYPHWRDYP